MFSVSAPVRILDTALHIAQTRRILAISLSHLHLGLELQILEIPELLLLLLEPLADVVEGVLVPDVFIAHLLAQFLHVHEGVIVHVVVLL